jgi:hypothetical protein
VVAGRVSDHSGLVSATFSGISVQQRTRPVVSEEESWQYRSVTMRNAHARATNVVALMTLACTKPAPPIGQAAPSSAEVAPQGSASARVARERRAAEWVRPSGTAYPAKLLALEPKHPWDFGSAQDGPSGHGFYPRGTFRFVAPGQFFERQFDVVFACGTEDRLSPPLAKGVGHVYRLELPDYFFEGNVATIDDCGFPRVGWVCPDGDHCRPPPSP